MGAPKSYIYTPMFVQTRQICLQNAVLLSVSSSIDGPLSKNTISSCLMILAESWQCKGFQMAKRLGPQSLNVRYSCCPKWVIFIATLFQFSTTSSLPDFQCTGVGSIDWHSLQFLIHQSPFTGSSRVTLIKMSLIIWARRGPYTSSSHPVVTVFALHFTNAVATHNHPHTRK